MVAAEAHARFAADAASASTARRFVVETLTDWEREQLCDEAAMLVTELVSNAVLHAGTDLEVIVRRPEGRLRVEVHDGSAQLPVRKRYSLTAATGRGLMVVDSIASRWGSELTRHGKVVWFELDDHVSARPPLADDQLVPDVLLRDRQQPGGSNRPEGATRPTDSVSDQIADGQSAA